MPESPEIEDTKVSPSSSNSVIEVRLNLWILKFPLSDTYNCYLFLS